MNSWSPAEHFGYLECRQTIKNDGFEFFQSLAKIVANLAKLQKIAHFYNILCVTTRLLCVQKFAYDHLEKLSKDQEWIVEAQKNILDTLNAVKRSKMTELSSFKV